MEQPYTRQLVMKLADLEQIPPLVLPEGYQIHTADVHSREVWEAIVESAFDAKIDYTEKLDRPALVPETRCWFVTVNGTDVATASSYNNKDYPGLGFLHMVATRKDARGLGAGRLAVLAVLHGLARCGLHGCVLTTDDFRLPAIGLYLSLGFVPVIDGEEMRQRWDQIYQQLNACPHKGKKRDKQ